MEHGQDSAFGGSSFATSSDERKKEVSDHQLGLDFVNQLRPVNYKFKAHSEVP